LVMIISLKINSGDAKAIESHLWQAVPWRGTQINTWHTRPRGAQNGSNTKDRRNNHHSHTEPSPSWEAANYVATLEFPSIL
jgi:uncharacterized protein involved in copper resistance